MKVWNLSLRSWNIFQSHLRSKRSECYFLYELLECIVRTIWRIYQIESMLEECIYERVSTSRETARDVVDIYFISISCLSYHHHQKSSLASCSLTFSTLCHLSPEASSNPPTFNNLVYPYSYAVDDIVFSISWFCPRTNSIKGWNQKTKKNKFTQKIRLITFLLMNIESTFLLRF